MTSKTILVWLVAYGIGCFATGYYLVRWQRGIDVRTVGSKTTGAFNVARVMKLPGFAITVFGDVMKGVLALGIARAVELERFGLLVAMIAVVMGHNFPVQLNFRGGNGLATATGALFLFDVQLAVALTGLFFLSLPVLFAAKKFFNLPVQYYTPSKLTVLATPVMAVVFAREWWTAVGLAGLVAVILWTIRGNMRNLRDGT